MIQVFRKNWFVFTLLLLPYTLLIRVWSFNHVPDWPKNTETHSLVYRYIEQYLPKEYLWNVIFASFVVFICAVLINNIVIKHRITREINLFPGLIFIFLSALHVDMFWTSPQLLSVVFLLLGFLNIFKVYRKPKATKFIFNTGLFFSIATLFYLPYSIFILIAILSILTLRKFRILDFIQFLVGYILPLAFTSFFRFWNDLDYHFFLDFVAPIHLTNFLMKYEWYEFLIFILILTFIAVALSNYRQNTIKKSIQSQKKVNLFYWQIFISLSTIPFVFNELLFNALIVLFVPLSVFIAMIFNRIRNEAALEFIHVFILFFIIFSHYWFN